MFEFFKRKPLALAEKDPKDFTKTASSTNWQTIRISCNVCDAERAHNDFMSDICGNCGSMYSIERYFKIYRKIYLGGKWVYQIKYKTGKEFISDRLVDPNRFKT